MADSTTGSNLLRHMARLGRGFIILTALGGFTASSAHAVEMQAGLWELKTTVERQGVPLTRPLRLICISPEAAKAARDTTSRDISAIITSRPGAPADKSTCTTTDVTNTKDSMAWRVLCASNPGIAHKVETRFDSPRLYRMVLRTKVTLPNETRTSVTTIDGRYKGECKP